MTKLREVNTTDLVGAIYLGIHTMCNSFNADDADIPFGGAQVLPEGRFSSSSESHLPGRHLNAVLNASDAVGIEVDEDCIQKHLKAAFFSYSQATLPLQRVPEHEHVNNKPILLQEHDIREGFHALYSLTKYRGSDFARKLAQSSIDVISSYWVPDEQWNYDLIEKDLCVKIARAGSSTFIQGLARAI